MVDMHNIRLGIKGFAIFGLLLGLVLPTVSGDFLLLDGTSEVGSGTFVELYSNRGVVYPPEIVGNTITVSEDGESFFGLFMVLFIIALVGLGLGLYQNYSRNKKFARLFTAIGTIFYSFIVLVNWLNVSNVDDLGEESDGMILVEESGSFKFFADIQFGISFYLMVVGTIALFLLPILNLVIGEED